jgi:hypothetical protein
MRRRLAASWLFCAFTIPVLAISPPASASAQDCPTAQSTPDGFVVERGQAAKIEVYHADKSIVRTLWQSGGETVLEVTLFMGFFELDRLDHGVRTSYRPKTDLAKLFPFSPRQKMNVEFESGEGDKQRTLPFVFSVNNSDPLYIGACKYDVFKIDRSFSQGGATRFLYSEYYSPALRFVIAKEFSSGTGPKTLNKYDRIYSLKH